MGGELYSSLFCGPKRKFTMYDLILMFVTTRENIIERIINSDDYVEHPSYHENDSCIISDYYEYTFYDVDLEILIEKLNELGIKLVIDNNVRNDAFNLGKQIYSIHIDMDEYEKYWKKYTNEKIDIFAGMYGDFDVYLKLH